MASSISSGTPSSSSTRLVAARPLALLEAFAVGILLFLAAVALRLIGAGSGTGCSFSAFEGALLAPRARLVGRHAAGLSALGIGLFMALVRFVRVPTFLGVTAGADGSGTTSLGPFLPPCFLGLTAEPQLDARATISSCEYCPTMGDGGAGEALAFLGVALALSVDLGEGETGVDLEVLLAGLFTGFFALRFATSFVRFSGTVVPISGVADLL